MEYGLRLWDTLWEAGQPEGLVAAGYKAIDSLRLEKGYRYWSSEISPDYTPLEAGLGFAVKLNKKDFIGKEALLKQKEAGLTRKLCCMTLSDSRRLPWARNRSARKTARLSAGWPRVDIGYSVEKSIIYAYLPIEFAKVGTELEVEFLGRAGRGCGCPVALMGPQRRTNQSINGLKGRIITRCACKRS